MDVSKFSCEMTSPDYTDHFYSLSKTQRALTALSHHELYKGINQQLIAEIYKCLYELRIRNRGQQICIAPNCNLISVSSCEEGQRITLRHIETHEKINQLSGAVVLATGYQTCIPPCIDGIRDRICFDSSGRYEAARNYAVDHASKEIFIQNAEMHSHGFSSADLGMGAYRNSVIINQLLGYEHYSVEQRIAFQRF